MLNPTRDYTQYATLSPFELKDQLMEIASSDAQRLMLNAGRGNPNFLATLPRWAFLSLGDFSLREAERSYSYLDSGFGGLPEHDGIVERFDAYANHHRDSDGVRFLRAALSYIKDQLGLDPESFMFEMVSAFLGCNYPTPPRMLVHTEEIVKAYLAQEMFGPLPPRGEFSVFATEGGTAAMTYIFQTLRANLLVKPGDRIAIATPIFSPYLEIPVLAEYGLEVIDIRMDRLDDWQLPQSEIDKLLDPAVKIFCLVNPSNPPSSKLSDAVLDQLAALVEKRPDLFIVTDDVYGTFADDFVSLFAKCPRNTLCVYSFSKFFGATGWRLGAMALHNDNVFDAALKALPEADKLLLDTRYASLTTTPRDLAFIDRLVADSRAVALNHTAGLSVPQQLQMALFALNGLMDRDQRYKDAAKQLIRKRYQTLYRNMGVIAPHQLNDVNYYSLIDLQEIGGTLYGPEFRAWFINSDLGISFLFRLAEETGVVLLPGNGFEVVDTSARVSLANLTEIEYASIGKFTRQVLDECFADFKKAAPAK
ncbi:bifunctional aspartate transaminase/aspartate 4-decarboxylase [Tardiphaga sp. vice352]|uniref:bifunctional aspartate transaminase/aspartate 4-decarboxylase n=1 Tax=unclassified Tardiphaga TaxID=2631404 RepID=UPI001164D0A7|nr:MULTISPECIES: bifunctional aspartate transaminase/aspartate 4-decarboxylase [unclassified Tardiphaga]QDM18218.1 bifunctional aspartate transaminase/aspartate 4-decarboxylase [Tardiphaga sp. vice278]QDM28445.1 bifunctional aspartate transaminase/aspartate 4-decarboxylase [Tardiphaga sp. vice304]QDM33542.1 bifunctional aspartate transaminase/aspartate 4-decarboxylase [Tardiphaga sp. vice352]